MGTDDYSSAIGGGLKLKGSKPAGVVKKKKKKDKDSSTAKSSAQLEEALSPAPTTATARARSKSAGVESEEAESREHDREPREQDGNEDDRYDCKTAAERKHEETRRKRLEDRLQKQGGLKTHKQRVEELNKYLSNLSEHHDMPRIGPG